MLTKKLVYCIKCGHRAQKETDRDLRKEYPYYCPYCDENLYSIEVYKVYKKKGEK